MGARLLAIVRLAVRGSAIATIVAPGVVAQAPRDSARILVVENTRPAWSDRERLRLAAQPNVVIGNAADSMYRFRQIHGVMRLADGRIAVADGRTMQLRFFDAEGRFVSAGAGRGTGPGQVLNMRWTQRLLGDTIAVGAGGLTVARYSSSGQHIRTVMPAGVNGRPPAFHLIAVMSNGSGIAIPFQDPAPRTVGSRWIESVPLKRVTASGEIAGDIDTLSFLEFEQVASGLTTVWLSPTAVIAAGDNRLYAGFGNRFEIRVYGDDGKLQSIIRRSWTPEPITDEDWEHWVVEWSKLWVRTTGPEREREVQKVREAPWAEEVPAFSQFIVDRTGQLWVRGAHWQDAIAAGSLSDIPAVPSTWSVFDIRGRWLGDVGMPAGFKPFEIGRDYVAGVRVTNGISQAVLYTLSTGGR
jgi:hypothetical protein